MKFVLALLLGLLAVSPARSQAITCGLPDDTPTAQAVLDAGQPLLLPFVNCNIRALNATNRLGPWISGFGLMSQITPIQSGVNVIDAVGSSNVTLKNFRICGMCNPSITPTTGILAAQNSTNYASDSLQIDHVRVDGNFTLAAFYNLQVASSQVIFSQFYNYTPGGIVVVMTGNNFMGAASEFTSINNANNYVPSDWTFDQVEIHELGGLPNAGTGLWIGGLTSFRMYGGNISSSHEMVSNNAVIVNGQVAIPGFNIIDGTTFYNDYAPAPACAFRNNAGAGALPLFRANAISTAQLVC